MGLAKLIGLIAFIMTDVDVATLIIGTIIPDPITYENTERNLLSEESEGIYAYTAYYGVYGGTMKIGNTNIMTVRLDPARLDIVRKTRRENESNNEYLRRAIDALAEREVCNCGQKAG